MEASTSGILEAPGVVARAPDADVVVPAVRDAVVPAMPADAEVMRFSAFHRVMHFFVMTSFVVLVFTGMPLKYSETGWARLLMRLYGGVSAAGIIHRLAAMMMIFAVVSELCYFALYIIRGKGPIWGPGSILPERRDWYDMKAMFRWFLGLGPRPHDFDRYTYWEKFEFCAASMGVATMVGTGLVLWFPEQATRIMPGIVLNLAMVNHSGGALLAMGFVFVFWHVFHAHMRPEIFPMDKAMFDGSVPVDAYAAERSVEFQRAVANGTLAAVLVGPHSRARQRVEDVAWLTITLAALSVWVVFAFFTLWLAVRGIGSLGFATIVGALVLTLSIVGGVIGALYYGLRARPAVPVREEANDR